jgi:predicted dehydrogenase
MKKIGIGVIGCGFIAQTAHLPNYLNNPHVKILAVADVNCAKLDQVKEKYDVDTYSDYKELLKRPDIDAVSICAPTNLHVEIATEAAELGKHILVEKPIALSLEEADRIISTAQKNRVKLMVGYNYRFLPNHQLAIRFVKQGRIGKPYFVRGQFASAGPYQNLEEAKKTHYLNPAAGGGALFDSGSHLIDLLLWMFGDVKQVAANMGTYMEGVQVEDVATVILQFKNGVLGEVNVTWVNLPDYFAMRNSNVIEIIGSEGKIESDFFGPSLSFYSKHSRICKLKGAVKLTPKPLDPKIPFFALQFSQKKTIDSFIDCILHDSVPPVPSEEARKVLQVTLSAFESFRTGNFIQLP